eukprot:1141991-Pelagomonas_calceolata.AAC.1
MAFSLLSKQSLPRCVRMHRPRQTISLSLAHECPLVKLKLAYYPHISLLSSRVTRESAPTWIWAHNPAGGQSSNERAKAQPRAETRQAFLKQLLSLAILLTNWRTCYSISSAVERNGRWTTVMDKPEDPPSPATSANPTSSHESGSSNIKVSPSDVVAVGCAAIAAGGKKTKVKPSLLACVMELFFCQLHGRCLTGALFGGASAYRSGSK